MTFEQAAGNVVTNTIQSTPYIGVAILTLWGLYWIWLKYGKAKINQSIKCLNCENKKKAEQYLEWLNRDATKMNDLMQISRLNEAMLKTEIAVAKERDQENKRIITEQTNHIIEITKQMSRITDTIERVSQNQEKMNDKMETIALLQNKTATVLEMIDIKRR